MSDIGNGILAAKLDILIGDFQEFKKDQKETNKDLREHAVVEDRLQSSIHTTIRWHTVIGTFMMGVLAYHVTTHGL